MLLDPILVIKAIPLKIETLQNPERVPHPKFYTPLRTIIKIFSLIFSGFI